MARSLTNIIKRLSLGLLMALALLVVSHAGASPVRVAMPDVLLLQEKIGSTALVDTRCDHKRKKRNCKHAGRLTATAIEPGTKRKASAPARSHAPIQIAASAAEQISQQSNELHLRLSYSAMYATTRRMHI